MIFNIFKRKSNNNDTHIDYSNIDENWYLENRVINQMNWYDENASKQKKYYYGFVVTDIVLSAMIPFLMLYIDIFSKTKFIVAFLGSVVTIISGVISTFQFQKKWTQYRTTSETIKHTKLLYLTKTQPYNKIDAFSIFVQNIELLISTETTNWAFYVQKNTRNEKSSLTSKKNKLSIQKK